MAETAPLVFEQPLNERMRTFLRLDFLYSQALYHNEMQSQWGSRAAMGSLLDILAIAARGDVRADVQKELERHLAQLNVFQSKPGVDSARLRTVMSNLLRLRADLVACGSNYLAGLKDSEFLSAIKHRSAIPGGTCEFDLPDFFFWLNQATDQRARSFNEWLATLRPLCDAIAELLWITRQHGKPRQEIARGRRVPHHLRARHADPAGAHRAAGGLGAVSGDQRVSLPLLACACWPGTACRRGRCKPPKTCRSR